MLLTDAEIMGGIGYGNDMFGSQHFDIKSLLYDNDKTRPVTIGYGSFKSSSDYDGKVTWDPNGYNSIYKDPYNPINQEPMGRSYRSDQVGSSEYKINYYADGYPKWNPNDPIAGIKYENNINHSNALAVENYFQTEQQQFGQNEDINIIKSKRAALNSYNNSSLDNNQNVIMKNNMNMRNDMDIANLLEKAFLGGKEHFNSSGNTFSMFFILLFIVFIVIAYIQNSQIQHLQKLLSTTLER